ncbi:hypothetical protein [Parvularcula lutaonensis]|uniref:Uncharacterized protein n=1 Tax=Parvularcula lutaonensis TaxID=491923 RepID=A0ABV7M9R3_9PROT|nr:hypothetical protein [Parvularcula lutaonensis]GGY47610.1 hypothetical protein GCM10007148_16260 [Parvularcula lutaonensis]
MMLSFIDQLWIQMGLKRSELRRERGRGVAYAVLALSCLTSTVLMADLVINFSGRFG